MIVFGPETRNEEINKTKQYKNNDKPYVLRPPDFTRQFLHNRPALDIVPYGANRKCHIAVNPFNM